MAGLITKLYSDEEMKAALDLLKRFSENTEQLTLLSEEQRVSMLKACGEISRPDREEIRKRQKDVKTLRRQKTKQENRSARSTTGIRSAREADLFEAPEQISYQSDCDSTKREYLLACSTCWNRQG